MSKCSAFLELFACLSALERTKAGAHYIFTFLQFYIFTILQFYIFTFLQFYIFTYSQRHPKDPTLGKLPSGAMALAPQFYLKEKPHGKNVHWRCGASATAPPQRKIRRKVAKWRCDARSTKDFKFFGTISHMLG